MAKQFDNIIMRGASGSLGDQLIFRNSNGRTIISAKKQSNGDRVYSEAQLAQQQAFRAAIIYAQSAKGEEIYRIKANGGPESPFNVAVADWFKAPEVLGIDLSGWNGGAGGLLRVQARDDVQVKRVIVRFSNTAGGLLEEGQAVHVGDNWWEYTTRSNLLGAVTVTATAVDLPGNMTELSREKTIS